MSARALPAERLVASWAERAGDRLAGRVDAAWTWLESAWAGSLAGKTARRLVILGREVASVSTLAGWATRVWTLVLPPCSPLRWQTWLGIGLGTAALLPTEVPLGLLFLLLPFWLRDRVRERLRDRPARGGADLQGAGAGSGGLPLGAVTGRGLPPWVLVSFFAFLAMVAGAVPGSVRARDSLVEFVFWVGYALVFLLAADAALRGRGEEVVWPLLALASLAGVVGIWQYVSGWTPPQSWVDPRFEGEITRVVGTFTNPTFFAEMMGLALPVTVALAVARRPWRERMVLGGFALLQAGGMLLSFSRGGWLGLAISLAVLTVLYDRRLLVLGIVLVLAAPHVLPPVLVERFASSFSLEDTSNSYRVFIWRGSWALARAYLWTGTGLGADSFVYTYPEYMIIQTPAPHAHSTFLEMLVELGVPGLAALLWFLLMWAWEVGKGVRRFTATTALGAGILATVAGHLLHGLVEFTWYSPRITLVFWALLGLALGAARCTPARGAAAATGAYDRDRMVAVVRGSRPGRVRGSRPG
ncbi:MAG: O-antigen ligase family protein [Bacillota bacterium]|nr:O-antigen ligase family protein [Bacillota bacterium]